MIKRLVNSKDSVEMHWRKSIGLGGALGGMAAYTYRRRLLARWLDLPPAQFKVSVRRNLRVPMPDGVMLATDHYAPREPGSFPTILIRTPYGRAYAPVFYAYCFAERGYHVVVQDVRGRFGSDGEFEPFLNESGDGAATVSWLARQPWFNGVLGSWGQSYLAYTQWALAMEAPEAVAALFPSLPSSRGPFTGKVDEAQLLELPLRWMVVLYALLHAPGGQGAFAPWKAVWRLSPLGQDRTLVGAFSHVPVEECDEVAIGEEVPYFRQIMTEGPPSQWEESDYSRRLGHLSQPVHLLGGWYDFMLGDMLADYEMLRAAGRVPFLTVGPWDHVHPEISRFQLQEGLAWFDAHLKGRKERLRRKAVYVYVMGADEWREFDSWPPPSRPTSFYLQPDQGLSLQLPPQESAADSYLYDPADPTPAVGGPLFISGAGARDNRALEARPDVLTYTTGVLDHDLDVVGPVKATLYVASSLQYADFFARLCDVHPDGRSVNVCDGIVRLHPERCAVQEKVVRVDIDMWATAYHIRPGHAIRLQVSSGAHPRFARNPGTAGAPISTNAMRMGRQTVYHDVGHPSALILPLL